MGEVYRGYDPRLDRWVAIKVIASEREGSPDAQHRFEAEIRAVAALNHKGICTVYDVGLHSGRLFLVLELLQGETLESHLRRKRLPLLRTLDLAIQIGEALSYAHDRGIIHRDIKTANIFITERGDAKVLDFGIAKLAAHRSDVDGGSPTEPGVVVGTLAYMSPEQMFGETIDARSDLYSFGVVLYEMTVGALPQKLSPLTSLVELIGPEPVASLRTRNRDVPEALDAIVRRALEHDADLRFQTASDLVAALRALRRDLTLTPRTPTDTFRVSGALPTPRQWNRWAVAAFLFVAAILGTVAGAPVIRERLQRAGDIRSIAVLPCRAPPSELDLGYQCNVIREDLVASLSGIPGLLVKPTEHAALSDDARDAVAVGRRLEVDAVLVMGVETRQANGTRTLDLPVQVLGVRQDGAYLWGHRYSGLSWDVLHESVGRDVQENLRFRLSRAEAQRLEVERVLQSAKYYWDQRSDSSLRRAIRLYQRVLAENDTIARAHAGVAKSYVLLSYYGATQPSESYGKAKVAARRALDLDPSLADAHATLGLARRDYDRDWAGAEQELSRAVELDPSDVTSRQWYAELMAMTGRFAAAESSIVKAIQLAPVKLTPRAVHGWILLCAGRPRDAERELRETLELNPDYYLTNWFLGETLAQEGRTDDAIGALKRAVALSSGAARPMADLGSVYGRSGRKDSANVVLRRLLDAKRDGQPVSRYDVAIARIGVGDAAGAVRDLEAALDERTWQAANIMIDPMLQPLRQHSQFESVVRKAGLSPSWSNRP
jgi:tetratricopeptide (TPR) repeat protein